MFWRCGGGRKVKTRKDFVSAASGFTLGTIDQDSTNGDTSTTHYPRGQDDRVASAHVRDVGSRQVVQRQSATNSPPSSSGQLAMNRSRSEDRPSSPSRVVDLVPHGLELASNQQASMPMLISPEGSEYYESGRGEDTNNQRPIRTNQSFSARAPNLLVAENLVRLDSADRPESHGWDGTRRVRPGGMDEAASLDVQSIRPGWLDETGPELGDTESIGFGARKSNWLGKSGSAVDDSVSGMGDTVSIGFGARKSNWMTTPGAAIDESVSGIGDTESIGFGARRSNWLANSRSVTDESVSGIGDTESIGFGAQKSKWLANPRSVTDESVSGIVDTESIGFGARESSWLAKPRSVIDESASIQPSWMYEEEASQRKGLGDGTAPAVGAPPSGWTSPKKTCENPSDNHELTRGGQSSSEGAARPRSELADSPKQSAESLTERTPPVVRTTKSDGGDSEFSDEGGLLGLIMDTNQKEAVRRRNQRDEKLRSAELARRVFSSCPNERNHNDAEDSSKHQTPRQGTAEVPAQIKILRSQTMPLSDQTDTITTAVVKAKRSSTPSASSRRHVPNFKEGGRTRERREKGPRDGTIGTQAPADAGALQGGNKGRRLPPAVQRNSSDDSTANDSPRKRGRRAPSPAKDLSRSPATLAVRGSSPIMLPPGDERESSGSTLSGKPPLTTKRFDSSGSEDSALAGKDAYVPGDVSRKAQQSSPFVRQRATSESTSDHPPPKVVISSSPGRKTVEPSKLKGRRSVKSKGKMESCIRESAAGEARPPKSSESGSTSSADSKNNQGIGIAKRGDRLPTGGRPTEAIRVTRARLSPAKSPSRAVAGGKTPPSSAPSTSSAEVKMWPSKDPASGPLQQREGVAHEPPTPLTGQGNVLSNLTKPISHAGRRGRVQQPLQFGTPRERNTTRNKSRTRMRPDLPPLKEEVGIPTSPISNRARHPSDGPGFSLRREDKSNHPRPGSAKDLAVRQLAKGLGNAAKHGAPTSSSSNIPSIITMEEEGVPPISGAEAALPAAAISGHALQVAGATATEAQAEAVQDQAIAVCSDKDEAGKVWLHRRARLHSGTPAREDSLRRRGSQRLSRSSSWDDGSSSSFHGPQAMFSPGRFNPTSGALSWGGSVDDSWCEGSVRSAMTAGTRNSSSASLVSARGPSDRKLVSAPQLSKTEKQTVERLKIKRSDVHFGYLTVGGSKRVYKIELNGEMRAAKVINMLGMNKEEMSEVLDTFDAELLALSRLNTPHIVKVYGASVSPAEIIVVSEFVEGGVLRSVLNNPRKLKNLTQRIRLGIAKDVAAGMRSLYAHGMQHRHLSSNSVLLTSDFRAKVLGVGLTMTTELIGFFIEEDRDEEEAEEELAWASREVLAGAGFSEKSDVYSFGIVLWEIMQKDYCLPYAGLLPSQVVGAKYNGEGPSIPTDCPPAIGRLMSSCWSNLPADRPSFDKIWDILEAI